MGRLERGIRKGERMPVRTFKPPLRERALIYQRVSASDLLAVMSPGSSKEHVPLTCLVKE